MCDYTSTWRVALHLRAGLQVGSREHHHTEGRRLISRVFRDWSLASSTGEMSYLRTV